MENRQAIAESQGYADPYTWLCTEYWTHGKSLPEIAGPVGLTGRCILNWMKEYGISRRGKGGGKSRYLPKILALDTSEMTAFEIAAAVGCTLRCVWMLARRYGLEYRRKQAKSPRGGIQNKNE